MKLHLLRKVIYTIMILLILCAKGFGQTTPLKYIDYNFENGSPLFWEIREDSSVLISLIYDHERDSPNRANGHWHFIVFAEKGTTMSLVLQNFDNIYNGHYSAPNHDNTSCFLSVDGKNWTNIETVKNSQNQLEIELKMPSDSVFVARLEPYRISDLEKLKSEINGHPLIDFTEIGKTVENRSLEVIRIGNESAPNQVFIRARAHAWEPGGNWVVQGMIKYLLGKDPDVKKYLKRYCIYVLPMANKDRVFHGGTRFNMRGADLNRNWDKPADPYISPENAALESWLQLQIKKGLKPDLVIDFHNDAGGKIHIARPEVNIEKYLGNMKLFEELLREYTWFTEGSTGGSFRTPGSLGEGMVERFGIDAFVFELNANWIAGLKKVPFGKDWELFGEELCEVFNAYFTEER